MVRAVSNGPSEVRGRVKRTCFPICFAQPAGNAGPTQELILNVAHLKPQRANRLLDQTLTARRLLQACFGCDAHSRPRGTSVCDAAAAEIKGPALCFCHAAHVAKSAATMVRAVSNGPSEVRGRVQRTCLPICFAQPAGNAGPAQELIVNVAH